MQRTKEFGKLLFRPIQHVLGKQSTSRAELQNFDLCWRSEPAPHPFELPRHQTPEYCMHIARCGEIAGFSELLRIARVVTQFGVVQAYFHVSRKRNRPTLADFRFAFLAQGDRASRGRSSRSCGVRMNISPR